MGWEKRRFNRVPVSLIAELNPVDIELNPLTPHHSFVGRVVDLNPTGMFIMLNQCFRTGTRYRITLKLDADSVDMFGIVRYAVQKRVGDQYEWGHGIEILGATQDTILKVVSYLERTVHQQTGFEASTRSILLPSHTSDWALSGISSSEKGK